MNTPGKPKPSWRQRHVLLLVLAIVLLVAMLFQIFRPMPKHAWTDEDETNTASAAVSA